MIHELKTDPGYFEDVRTLKKQFEVRKNDRGFQEGDFLALNEHDGRYTGRSMLLKVTYVLDNPQYCKDGYVIMGITPCRITAKGEACLQLPLFDMACVPVYGQKEAES